MALSGHSAEPKWTEFFNNRGFFGLQASHVVTELF